MGVLCALPLASLLVGAEFSLFVSAVGVILTGEGVGATSVGRATSTRRAVAVLLALPFTGPRCRTVRLRLSRAVGIFRALRFGALAPLADLIGLAVAVRLAACGGRSAFSGVTGLSTLAVGVFVAGVCLRLFLDALAGFAGLLCPALVVLFARRVATAAGCSQAQEQTQQEARHPKAESSDARWLSPIYVSRGVHGGTFLFAEDFLLRRHLDGVYLFFRSIAARRVGMLCFLLYTTCDTEFDGAWREHLVAGRF